MKKVKKEKGYKANNETEVLDKIDFSDTFSTTNHKNTIVEIACLIFNTMPL